MKLSEKVNVLDFMRKKFYPEIAMNTPFTSDTREEENDMGANFVATSPMTKVMVTVPAVRVKMEGTHNLPCWAFIGLLQCTL